MNISSSYYNFEVIHHFKPLTSLKEIYLTSYNYYQSEVIAGVVFFVVMQYPVHVFHHFAGTIS